MNCLCPEPIGHRDAPQHCEWRRIEFQDHLDFNNRFWVSSDGDVWGPYGLMSQHLKSDFKAVVFNVGKRQRSYYVHRLVARAFLPDWRPNRFTNFVDGDKFNCRADNLEWRIRATKEQGAIRRLLGFPADRPARHAH